MTRPPLLERVEQYLASRRARGYSLRVHESLLRTFARFAYAIGHTAPLSVDLAVRWAQFTRTVNPEHPARRLAIVRCFARALAAVEPGTEVPPPDLLRVRPSAARRCLPTPRTRLLSHIDEYVAMRRSLGYRLSSQEDLLRSLARFAHAVRHRGPLTVDLAVRWAHTTTSTDPAQPTRRLQVARGFAKYLAAFEPGTEIPPAGLLGHPTRRRPPHIYSEAEIAALLRCARRTRPRGGLRPHTYYTLFSLLVSTGLRVGEARRLRVRDVDLNEGLMTIRETKFNKSRLVPLHPSAIEALRRYALQRDRCRYAPRSDYFFRTDHSPCLSAAAVDSRFCRLRRQLGWTEAGRSRLPRVHDLRHTFVVRRMLRWCAERVDIDRKILHLATYLGHANVSGTYWYLSAVPELMTLAARRFEHAASCGEKRLS